jgi:hypothetical protein
MHRQRRSAAGGGTFDDTAGFELVTDRVDRLISTRPAGYGSMLWLRWKTLSGS